MRCGLYTLVYLALIGAFSPVFAADNMEFRGTLRAQACTLHPDDAVIPVSMQATGLRDLQLGRPGAENSFIIRLINCNLQVAGDAVIRFTGQESAETPGALKPDGTSQASGVALLLKNAQKQQVRINGAAVSYPLSGQETSMMFYSELMGEPSAVAGGSITPGYYSASATFYITYP